ncbi:DUF3726 domain-containing protein [Paracoccus shandongensis]|uniref:DUF3726 domain-containing protein n=1 Tax=Paracoccus shandongensis TaxID=2816048 RepID=UPI001A8E33B0|nr:DUF3726 domain-containing protein [Paracoccus shandongensis]
MILSDIKTAAQTHPADPIRLSCNETAALCFKAARGAGMAWGLAEEAAFATGWLCAHGIDGAGALLRHLDAVGDAGSGDLRPWPQPGYWRAGHKGILCPIRLGASLLDHAGSAQDPLAAAIRTDAVSMPVLLVPFLAEAGRRRGDTVQLSCRELVLALDKGPPDLPVLAALSRIPAAPLWLAPAAGTRPASAPDAPLPGVAPGTVAALEAYALRITVPATEASRRGAGTGSNDND